MPTIDNRSTNDYYLDYSILDRKNGDIFKQAVNNLSKILGSANEEYKDSVFRMFMSGIQIIHHWN